MKWSNQTYLISDFADAKGKLRLRPLKLGEIKSCRVVFLTLKLYLPQTLKANQTLKINFNLLNADSG